MPPFDAYAYETSPCIGVCKANEAGICKGCYRSLSEIAKWATISDSERGEINRNARQRRITAESRNADGL